MERLELHMPHRMAPCPTLFRPYLCATCCSIPASPAEGPGALHSCAAGIVQEGCYPALTLLGWLPLYSSSWLLSLLFLLRTFTLSCMTGASVVVQKWLGAEHGQTSRAAGA